MNGSATFPDGFLWGAATSAYQIEGSPLADGAGPSIWHTFTRLPGRVANGDTGDEACDHYHRADEDVALMRALGLNAYRFSIAWSRILPEGRGAVNRAGLAFYDRLCDLLLDAGIQPMATLFHWDLPEALDRAGGWGHRDSADWFADYARIMTRALGDRVAFWATLNEPWVVVDGGYVHGVLAPGRSDLDEAARAAHNLLRAHGAGLLAIRAEGGASAGLVVNLEPKYPASDRSDDLAATHRADAWFNRQFLDPVLLGAYPEELAGIYGRPMEIRAGDWEIIRQPLDFLGVNYYTRAVIRHDPAARPTGARTERSDALVRMTTDWEVYPEGLGDVLAWLRGRYPALPPLYITENGGAFADPPSPNADGVHDPARVACIAAHLRVLRRAIAEGADVRGYFVWSLFDNFEWAHGYDIRFGICHVDYATQRRTPKTSARFYTDVIRSHGASLDDPPAVRG